MDRLCGKVAVVTGGGSGIGRGIVRALAREGMSVVVADIELEAAEEVAREVASLGAQVLATAVDVSDLASVSDLRDRAVDRFGPVHVLCNNAGVTHRRRAIHATHADWQWLIGVNLWGVVHGVEVFIPPMLDLNEPCHVVNTSSMNGIFPSGLTALYSTSKYAVTGLTETLRNELAGSNIGVSLLCPGAVQSRIMESERNRPAELQAPTEPPEFEPTMTFDLSGVLEPEVVGEIVVDGIRRDALYIFTDLAVRKYVVERFEGMLRAFDDLQAFEQGRGYM